MGITALRDDMLEGEFRYIDCIPAETITQSETKMFVLYTNGQPVRFDTKPGEESSKEIQNTEETE